MASASEPSKSRQPPQTRKRTHSTAAPSKTDTSVALAIALRRRRTQRLKGTSLPKGIREVQCWIPYYISPSTVADVRIISYFPPQCKGMPGGNRTLGDIERMHTAPTRHREGRVRPRRSAALPPCRLVAPAGGTRSCASALPITAARGIPRPKAVREADALAGVRGPPALSPRSPTREGRAPARPPSPLRPRGVSPGQRPSAKRMP